MGGFFWLRPDGAYVDGVRVTERIPCDDVTLESLLLLPWTDAAAAMVAPKHAPFPAGALGASWSIAALVYE